MHAKQFLLTGGLILLVLGLLGFIPGIIGPDPSHSIFGGTWYFDNAENWANTVLGILMLIAAFAVPASVQKWVAVFVGVVAIVIGIYGMFSTTLLGATLENPADTLLHLGLGAWALVVSFAGSVTGAKVTT